LAQTVPKLKVPVTAQERLADKRNLFKKASDVNDPLNSSVQSLPTEGDDAEPPKSDRDQRSGH